MSDCYLKSLGNCSGGISREHYISRAVLDLIFSDNRVMVSGLPWTKEDFRTVSKNSLTAKVLCAHDNSYLSFLDSEGMKLFSAVQNAQRDLQAGKKRDTIVKVNGDLFERWLLKISLGLWASGNFGKSGAKLQSVIPEKWASVLVGTDFPVGSGIYASPKKSEFAAADREFECIPHSGSDDVIRAVQFGFARIPFTLAMGRPDYPLSLGYFRPLGLTFTDGKSRHLIDFEWKSGPHWGPIEFTRLRDA